MIDVSAARIGRGLSNIMELARNLLVGKVVFIIGMAINIYGYLKIVPIFLWLGKVTTLRNTDSQWPYI